MQICVPTEREGAPPCQLRHQKRERKVNVFFILNFRLFLSILICHVKKQLLGGFLVFMVLWEAFHRLGQNHKMLMSPLSIS